MVRRALRPRRQEELREARLSERGLEMHHPKKGNQWYLGMKVHIGVDADTGLVHSMTTTTANTHDVTEAHRLLHGGETPAIRVLGSVRRTWGVRWTGRWRCVRDGGGSWSLGAMRL